MEGLLLILLAFALIIAELYLPTFGILGLIGVGVLFAGGHFIIEQGGIFGYPLDWPFFIGLAVSVTSSLVLAVYVIARNRHKKPVAGIEGMIGHDAKVIDWSGKSGHVHVQGELWSAFSEREHQFQSGDIVTISGIDDLYLRIHSKN